MATSDELFIVQSQNGIVGIQEVGVKDDFYTIGSRVEQLDTADLVQNRIVGIIGHIVSRDWG